MAKARNVITDIRSTDRRIADSDYYSASSSLWLLADSFERVLEAGIPAGVDPATYTARLKTLESFADQASNEIAGSPTQGSARYAIIREETGVVLTQLTEATGVELALP